MCSYDVQMNKTYRVSLTEIPVFVFLYQKGCMWSGIRTEINWNLCTERYFRTAIPNTSAISASYMVLLLIHLLPVDSHDYLYSSEQKNNFY